MSGHLSMGQLARESGVGLETVRFYERIGLMPEPPRTSAGHRVYGEEHLKRLVFIRRGRELGFGLDAIRELLGVAQQDGPVCSSVQKIATPHLDTVRQKIADLTRLEAMLAQALAGCTGDMAAPECPVLNMMTEDDGGGCCAKTPPAG